MITMKSLIKKSLIFFLCMASALGAQEANCQDKLALLTLFKIKEVSFMRMADANIPKTKPFQCQLLTSGDIDKIEKAREEAMERCQKTGDMFEDKSKSLVEVINGGLSTFDADGCVRDFQREELLKLVRQTKNSSDIKGICRVFSPFNEAQFQRAEYCSKVSSAEADPQTCEIAGPNGKCPGAPLGAQESSENNEQSFVPPKPPPSKPYIDWGEQKKKSGAKSL